MTLAALPVFVPLELMGAAFDPAGGPWPNQTIDAAFLVGTSLVAIPWASGAMVLYLDKGGSPIGAYGRVANVKRGLVLGGWLAYAGTLLALVLLIVPGLILLSRWSLLVPAVVLRGKGARAGLRESNGIVRGATARVLAALTVMWAAAIVLAILPSGVAEAVSPGVVASFVLSLSFDVLTLPLVMTGTYVLYRQLLLAA